MQVPPHKAGRRGPRPWGPGAWALAALGLAAGCGADRSVVGPAPTASGATDAGVVGVPDVPPTAVPNAMRRLSRAEYLNTVRDLLGDYAVDLQDLPADQVGYLFFNIGGTQTLARFDVERYLHVAEGVIDRAWARRAFEAPEVQPSTMGPPDAPAPGFAGGHALRFDGSTDALLRVTTREPGAVSLRVQVRPEAAPAGPLRLSVVQDDFVLASADIASAWPAGAEVRLDADPIWRTLPVPDSGLPLSLRVQGATREAPVLVAIGGLRVPALRADQRLPTCDPAAAGAEACMRRILGAFARRAWRRPVADEDLARLVALAQSRVASGESFDDAVKVALTAVLVSPRFLFRVERSAEGAAGGAAAPRDAYELAVALSYFLWAAPPDAALDEAAASGRLLQTDEIERQVRRMVADPKFDGFVHAFAGQWLSFNGAASDPLRDTQVLPNRPRPEIESALFVGALFRDNEPLRALLAADWTYIAGSLSSFYGYTGPIPLDGFVRVSLAGLPRRGYLTQPSFLTVTSPSIQITEPTVRGFFILSRLLCSEPPPPPRFFDNFANEFTQRGQNERTFRTVLEEHIARPECASCHAVMDPIGFAFDNYGVLGEWRTEYQGHVLDTTGSAPGLGSFRNALELIGLIQDDARIPTCAVRHLMTYALGRGDLSPDLDGLDAVRARFEANGFRLLDLLVDVATSPAFRARLRQESH